MPPPSRESKSRRVPEQKWGFSKPNLCARGVACLLQIDNILVLTRLYLIIRARAVARGMIVQQLTGDKWYYRSSSCWLIERLSWNGVDTLNNDILSIPDRDIWDAVRQHQSSGCDGPLPSDMSRVFHWNVFYDKPQSPIKRKEDDEVEVSTPKKVCPHDELRETRPHITMSKPARSTTPQVTDSTSPGRPQRVEKTEDVPPTSRIVEQLTCSESIKASDPESERNEIQKFEQSHSPEPRTATDSS